jgi:hypothetical protein
MFLDSDRSKLKWFKSNRLKSNIFPSDVCINDKFYPRCFERTIPILGENGKPIGCSSPNISLPVDFRVKWYVDVCQVFFALKPETLDLSAAHLNVFASSMHLPELTDRVLGGDMWKYVIQNLPQLFNKKSFLKKILYSGLNGGYPSTFSNGWAELGFKDEKDEKFFEAVKLFKEAKQKEILFTSLDKFNQRATLLQERNSLFSVLSLQPIQNINIKKNETKKLGHRAGSRVLASSEQLLMYALATDFIQSGAIILAPEHDGMVVLPSPGFK